MRKPKTSVAIFILVLALLGGGYFLFFGSSSRESAPDGAAEVVAERVPEPKEDRESVPKPMETPPGEEPEAPQQPEEAEPAPPPRQAEKVRNEEVQNIAGDIPLGADDSNSEPLKMGRGLRGSGRGGYGYGNGAEDLGKRRHRIAKAAPFPKRSAERGNGPSQPRPQVMLLDGDEYDGARRAKEKRQALTKDPAPPAFERKPKTATKALRTVVRPDAPAQPASPVLEEPEAFEGFENRAVALPETSGDEKPIDRKPMVDTRVDPMSTFAIDVDTGAYTLARARLREGYLPKKEDVRIEEFLNYFHYAYPQPKEGAFAVALEAAPDPFAPGTRKHLVRVGVQGREVGAGERPPAHLTFLIDVSGSMFGVDRLELAREALGLVTRNLRPDDTVAIVTFARGAKVELWPAGASEKDIVTAAIARLEAGGSSAMDEGLRLAYQVAATHFYAGQINRVVVMGDGRANVGKDNPDELLLGVRAGVEDGVVLSTIGFGARAFNDQMMERLADQGNGNYFFVDSYREAERVFGDRLCGTLHVIAKDVKIQVEFNPDNVVRHRLLGYENRKLKHSEFRDDAVDAGEIGAGHSVTALYEVELAEKPSGTLAAVRVRHKEPAVSVAEEVEFHLYAEELHTDVRKASADFRFAAAVALFAEVLKGDAAADPAKLSLVKEIAGDGAGQADRTEFLALVDQAAPYYAMR